MNKSSSGIFCALAATVLVAGCSAGGDEDVGASDEELVQASHTHLDKATNALVLDTRMFARVEDCKNANRPNCADRDGDQLVDAWEHLIIDRFRPAITFDEDEPFVHSGGKDKLADIARVAPSSAVPGHVFLNVLFAYSRDYGVPIFYCFGASAHPGDVERIAIELSLSGNGNATMVRAFTTGHEGDGGDDQSHVFQGSDLHTLEYVDDATTGQKRWRVFASEGKHATYATKKLCQGATFPGLAGFCLGNGWIPGLHEDCAPDGVSKSKLADYTKVPIFVNAGEPDKPLVDDLTSFGPPGEKVSFPGEKIWTDLPFCGSQPVNHADCRDPASPTFPKKCTCPPSLKSKLLRDPFVGK